MEERIKEAIELLQKNNYVVKKFTSEMDEDSDSCAESGYGDCMSCSCFVCMAGIE